MSLRECMLADKDFLKQLYSSDSIKAKTILNFAKDSSLKTLVKVIHNVTTGKIELRSDIFDEIVKRKKLNYLISTFEAKGKVKSLLQGSRQELLLALYKLSTVYKYILHPLFWRKS